MRRSVFTCLATFILWSGGAPAAEIHFRADCRSDGGLVLLGDVADVFGASDEETKRLSAIDLVPAPPRHEKRVMRAREIQDLLHLRGIDPNSHRFTGASQVAISGVGEAPVAAAPAKKPGYLNVPLQQITVNVRTAIKSYIVEQTADDTQWEIKFDLKPEQAQSLAAAGQNLTVDGGESPWTGLQNLTLSFKSLEGIVRVPLSVQITPPPSVVVTLQSLARGAIIKASDVRLQAGKPATGSVYVFSSIEEVVGKEAARALVEGQILDEQVVRRPILVERSDVVTVYARTSGLRVRTTARALEAGGEGDLVRVEAMNDRKSYFARVSGPQEVEVFAHAPTAGSESASTGPPAGRVAQASHNRRLPTAPLPPEETPPKKLPVATK